MAILKKKKEFLKSDYKIILKAREYPLYLHNNNM